MRRFVAIILICLCCFSVFSAPSLERYVQYTSSAGNSANQTSAAQAATLSELMYALGNLYTYLDQNFLYEIDNQKMQDAVISAMIDSLGDKYPYYVTPEDAASYAEDNRGKYVGIGTYVSKVNPKYIDWNDPTTYMLQIVSPFPGGPADRAGLRAGDLISHADGEELYELDATAASRRIRGVYGKSITLTVHRGSSVFDITLYPEVVKTPSTSKCILSDDIGYLAITEFSMTTYESVVEDLTSLMEEGAKSLIIDVRNNGGGVVDAALNIANLFVPEGKVLLTTKFKENSGNKNAT
ncbi:MAG: PDZ domain-containing protein, partial [Spirochaetales bacterium]|nr:PDZ domain-containing protein [Candidatus Physcosoma equi]